VTNGCLIIHGLTGTPATVAILQEAFLSAGFRTCAPYLAGHGGSVEDLAASNWRQWYDTVRTSYSVLRKEVDRIFCAGISLGALLGMKLALDEGWGIRAIALLSTPLKLPLLERMAIPLVRYGPLRSIIKRIPKDLEKSVGDPDGRMRYEQLSLPSIPVHAVYQISDLQKNILASLHRFSNPVLLLHGKDDRVAPPFNVNIVRDAVASDIVESVIFEKSRHVLTMDIEKDRVAKTAVDFFKRFA